MAIRFSDLVRRIVVTLDVAQDCEKEASPRGESRTHSGTAVDCDEGKLWPTSESCHLDGGQQSWIRIRRNVQRDRLLLRRHTSRWKCSLVQVRKTFSLIHRNSGALPVSQHPQTAPQVRPSD